MTEDAVPRSLSHDEKKAAEAAFAGRPFNAAWSTSARLVYDGIVKALPKQDTAPVTNETAGAGGIPSAPSLPDAAEEPVAQADTGQDDPDTASRFPFIIQSREQAIEAGALIDVTPTARRLGLPFPVTITRPLWETGIETNQTLSEEERAGRLRDVLLAFRIRLAGLATISPLVDFPAMLTLPPGTVPQPVPLFALIQPDKMTQASVTLLLPNEISFSIVPSN
jgi:hypothetical protein